MFNIDIVGFSRGAAAARDFANVINERLNSGYYSSLIGGNCARLNLRFMGLFDSVLSTHTGDFNLAIPASVRNVAHAYAINEHRTQFPLESIEYDFGSPGSFANRIERGFIGAHSDVGGGYNCDSCDNIRGDLSDVALNWMVQQATRAGVRMNPLPSELRTVSSPVLHSELNAGVFYNPDPNADREVRYPSALNGPDRGIRQGSAPLGGLSRQQAEQWITRSRDPGAPPELQGRIDMAGYAEWLRRNYQIQMNN